MNYGLNSCRCGTERKKITTIGRGAMDVVTKFFSLKQSEADRALGLETASEYRERWISIRVMYYTGFLVYVAFGIITTSAWPYLRSVRIMLHNLSIRGCV